MNAHFSRLIPAPWRNIAKVFVALGDEQRQRILLSFEPGERLNVGQIAEGSTLARSTVSHHLKVLYDAQILEREKIGKEIYFWVNKQFLQETFDKVLEHLNTKM